MNEAFLIAGMMVVTFGVRYVPMLIVGRVALPDTIIRALRFVPVAVLTAIIVPAMFMPQGNLDIQLANAYLIGGIVALLVSWRTKNLLLTIVVGMGFFLFWRAIFPVVPSV
jgi:branched-subunit amino acid transport protein